MQVKANRVDTSHKQNFDGNKLPSDAYNAKRADGSINTHPQERMHASSEKNSN